MKNANNRVFVCPYYVSINGIDCLGTDMLENLLDLYPKDELDEIAQQLIDSLDHGPQFLKDYIVYVQSKIITDLHTN